MSIFISEKIAIGVFLLVFLGTSIMIPGVLDDVDIIKQRLMSLGFLECSMDSHKDGSYSIKVNAYAERTQALSLDGVFQPFEVRAQYSNGILSLEKADIERAGFSVDADYLPRGVKIVRLGIITRSLQRQEIAVDPDIQRIERALKDTKRNRKRVFANARSVVHKGSSSFAMVFPDVCKTPSNPGPIPIPYPNIAKSSDTAKGAKAAKADKAATIAKESYIKKSESDEVATSMDRLQKSYQKIIAKRELGTDEMAVFKKELKACLDKAALLKKTLDVYVEEIEKLLHEAKK